MPTSLANEKRNNEPNGHHRRHAAAAGHNHGGRHQYLHNRYGKVKEKVEESRLSKRAVGDLVFATIDGQLVSWTNVYAGPTGVPALGAVGNLVSATIDGQLVSWASVHTGPGVATDAPALGAVDDTKASTSSADTIKESDVTSPSSTLFSTTTTSLLSSSTSSTSIAPATSEGWVRQAYFNAASGMAEGLTFLNHFGGTDGIPGTSAGESASGNLDHVGTEWEC